MPIVRCVLSLVTLQLCVCWSRAADATFGPTNVWTIEVRLTPNAWRVILNSRTFVQGEVMVNGVTHTNVAVRQKGGGTSSGAGQGRPPLHLNFKGQRVAGVHKLSLNNNIFDGSYLRDVLSYKLCNDFGVPAPRTAFAKLYVKTGDRPATYVGLYTATEIVDEAWVAAHLGVKGGLLMKAQAPMNWQARNWKAIAERVVPKTTATEAEQARMVEFARFVNSATDAAVARDLSSYIDLDNFLRFLVLNVALANHDSYFAMGKNYYFWLNPATRKLTWIPWDFDLSFGGHFLWGTPGQRINLTIDRPSDDRLIVRVLAIPELKERYHTLMREFLDKHFQVAATEQQIETLAALIEPAVMADSPNRRARFKPSLDGRGRELGRNGWQVDVGLKQFVEERVASVNDQLAGKSKGELPRFGMR